MESFKDEFFSHKKPLIAYFPALDYDAATKTYYIPDSMKERNTLYLKNVIENGGEILNVSFNSSLELLTHCDGLLIPGGADIDPMLYNQRKDPRTVVHELGVQRAEMEKKIIEMLPKKLPILGICYGAQILNVFSGGTLVQHVEGHRQGAKHQVIVEKDSKLFELIGEEMVLSHCNHHQIVDVLGRNIRVNSRDINGMVHGVESTEKGTWMVAVQWHPERCQDELNKRIFKRFVEKCKDYRRKKLQEEFEKTDEFWLYF